MHPSPPRATTRKTRPPYKSYRSALVTDAGQLMLQRTVSSHAGGGLWERVCVCVCVCVCECVVVCSYRVLLCLSVCIRLCVCACVRACLRCTVSKHHEIK